VGKGKSQAALEVVNKGARLFTKKKTNWGREANIWVFRRCIKRNCRDKSTISNSDFT